MKKKPDYLVLIFLVLLIVSCMGGDIPDDNASREPAGINKDNKQEISPVKQLDPWSNVAIWKQLDESKSSASFSVKINDKLPNLTFNINGKFKDKDFYPINVEMRDSTSGKIIQSLNAKGKFDNHGYGFSEVDLHFADLVQFMDLNGDGFLDLRLLFEAGATGNNWYATYIYDPKTNKFKYHRDLSILSGVTQDPDTKIIKTYWRIGGCCECREHFKMVLTGRLHLEKLEWTEWHSDDDDEEWGCIKYSGVPKDKHAVFIGHLFYNMANSHFERYIQKNVTVTKKEEIEGSLDERPRGVMGTPMD